MDEIRLIPPNTLPVPYPLETVSTEDQQTAGETVVEINDNFPKGRVEKYSPRQGGGFIRSHAGHLLPFSIRDVRFAGQKGADLLKEGAIVGYDICRSGSNLRISRIKIY